MKRTPYIAIIFVLTMMSLLVLCGSAFSDKTGMPPFTINWYSVDGGADTVANVEFQIQGTIGQHDAGPIGLTGGAYTLHGGFHAIEPEIASCVGDIDNSGEVNVADLLALLAQWGNCPGCPADLNNDAFVDVSDLLTLLGAWGPCETTP